MYVYAYYFAVFFSLFSTCRLRDYAAMLLSLDADAV